MKILLFALCLVFNFAVSGHTSQVDTARLSEATLLLATLAFDHSIDNRYGDSVEIAVVGTKNRSLLSALQKAAKSKKIGGKPIEVISLSYQEALQSEAIDVAVFAHPLGNKAQQTADILHNRSISTYSVSPQDVAQGIMIGIETHPNGKPKLLLHSESAQKAGAHFKSQVLRLATLVAQ